MLKVHSNSCRQDICDTTNIQEARCFSAELTTATSVCCEWDSQPVNGFKKKKNL